MEKYVAQLKKIDADFGSDGETKPSKKSELEFEQSSSPARILMEGALYKQQDVFKGWTCRYFVLDERYVFQLIFCFTDVFPLKQFPSLLFAERRRRSQEEV